MHWNERETKIIEEFFPSGDLSAIEKLTGRKIGAIKSRAKRMKLHRLIKYDLYFEKIPLGIRSYFSGVFDGEGCIKFSRRGKTYSPGAELTMSCKAILALFKNNFNGSKIRPKKQGKKKANKILYTWNPSNFNDLYNLLRAILPFAIEKKEQILIALEHLEEYQMNGNKNHPTDEMRNRSKIRAFECSQLKKS